MLNIDASMKSAIFKLAMQMENLGLVAVAAFVDATTGLLDVDMWVTSDILASFFRQAVA